MAQITLKQVYQMREMVLDNYSVSEISEILGVSKSIVYSYTKAERKRMKDKIYA